MSRLVLLALVLLAIVVSVALARWVLGRAEVVTTTRTYVLVPFQRAQISGGGEVKLEQGEAEQLAVEGLPSGVRLSADVRDGTLHMAIRSERHWWDGLLGTRTRPVRVTLGFRRLDAIEVSGAVSLVANGLAAPALVVRASGGSRLQLAGVRCDRLEVTGNGALKARLAGIATRQSVSISGAGQYDALGLASEVANVQVSGVGQALLNVSRLLDADISGAASIEYVGNPQVQRHVSGVGRIRRRADDDSASRERTTFVPIKPRARRSA